VHLAFEQLEVDVVVGEDARELLRDATELENGAILSRKRKRRAEWPASSQLVFQSRSRTCSGP
jgi:hypothetical protein